MHVRRDLQTAAERELFQDVVHVAPDCVRGDMEPVRDLLVAHPGRDQIDHFLFPFGQPHRLERRPSPRRTARSAIWEKSETVKGGGRMLAPCATDRIACSNSSNVAAFRTNPDTPARTYSTTSSCIGRSPIKITFDSGDVRRTE